MEWTVRSPILVFGDGDLDVSDSLEEAARSMEAIDVRDEVYVAFDAIGRVLKIKVGDVRYVSRWWRRVRTFEGAILEPTAAVQPDQLLERLQAYVHAVGPERMELDAVLVDGLALADLVRLVDDFGSA